MTGLKTTMAKASVSSVPTRSTAHGRSIGSEIHDILRVLVRALGKRAVGAIVKKDVRTVDRWLAAKQPRVGVEEDRVLRDTYQIYEILAVDDNDHTVRAWFLGMNPQLDDQSPIDLLVGGRARAVIAAARMFANG
jgi:hypothetical protein